MPTPLGPFELHSPLARGGMATVWTGRHVEQDVPVAIKVMSGLTGTTDDQQRFAEEVRAVAALDHPGVVMVLDHGRIDARAAAADERLVEGSPWLAMEFASGGTLARLKEPLPWPALKALLLALLDALAHAHAHGVVHRDLKPANVLLATRQDQRPGLKLSDFGIASAAAADEGDLVVGTPAFMAPEQVRAEWRDQGPWTDLYALGCVVWWLVTGRPPFQESRPQATMMAHLLQELPAFQPRLPVPDGFEDWTRTLLRRDFDRRYQRAADAAWALDALGEPPLPTLEEEIPDLDPAFQDTLTATRVSFAESWRLVGSETTDPALPSDIPAIPPFPATWRRPVPRPPPLRLKGAGLSLYGLRKVPLAGRESERDLLWAELQEVARTGRARLVLVRGPAGTGKTRLCEWLCRRAHELGAAEIAKAVFARELPPGEAIRRMGTSWLKTEGLPRDRVADRVGDFLRRHGSEDEDEAAVLTELLCPATAEDLSRGERVVRLTRPREYYAGTSATMYRLATRRPLIAWLDDVQWGLHGLGLALEVLRTQELRPFPCLLLLAMRDEALDEEGDEARRLARLMDTPGATRLALRPLPKAAHRELVRDLLGLDDTLATRVEERTAGNPLFAVQLVGSWVQDGTLEVGGRGFVLKRGARAELPDDLFAVWTGHLDRVLADFRGDAEFPTAVGEYLEIAACLGQEVSRREWRRACDDPAGHFGDRFPGDEALRTRLVDRLLAHHLVVSSDRESFAFVHAMLREALLRQAREGGRWTRHQRSCAQMLASLPSDPQRSERLGRHLLEAGSVLEAVEPLLQGVEHRLQTIGPVPAEALLATAADALRTADPPPTDPRWGRSWTVTARCLEELGRFEPALVEAQRARLAGRRHGWRDVEQAATAIEGSLLVRLRRDAEAEELLRGATRPEGLMLLGRMARRKGDVGRARGLLARAAEQAEGLVLADIRLEEGRVEDLGGDPEEAARRWEQAAAVFEEAGAASGASEAREHLGLQLFRRDLVDQAVTQLARAASLQEALGSERQLRTRLWLARAQARTEGGSRLAWDTVERLVPLLSLLDHHGRAAATLGVRLVKSAAEGAWATWDEVVSEAMTVLPRAGAQGEPAIGLALIGVELAAVGGQAHRADVVRTALRMLLEASGQRDRLGALQV